MNIDYMVVVPRGARVVLLHPGDSTMGMRVDEVVIAPGALQSDSSVEQMVMQDWYETQVLTRLRPKP